MELECDLSQIKNEELLRKMWQHSEDTNRKKEIRSQLFKLREARLRDLYQGDIMSNNTIAGFGKDPLRASHGDALADQSFQSLKSKEIRDSMSPTEMKFQSMALNHPTTTGWNVQSSKELSPDGRGFRTESVATTDGVENINGGTAEFKGRNEQRSSAHHQGDDKNFVKKAMESSNSHLQEKVVLGDENSGRTEVRSSSTTSTSSSQVFQSSSNVEYDDRAPIAHHPQHHQPYLMDHPHRHHQQQQQKQEEQRIQEEHRLQEQQFRQQHQQHVNQQQERRTSEQLSTTRQNTEQNVQTQETHEQNKRYVDMDKASPEYQQHVQYLMQQPGEVISQNVEYPKPNVKMITTVKRLPDGTIVRNKRYETEEMSPTTIPTTRPTSTNQTNQRRDSQQQTKNYPQDLTPSGRNPRRPTEDLVDNRETTRYAQDIHSDDLETKFSSVKKSSRKFSTESTSETIHESSHPETSRIKPVSNDFSTHGFPSVKATKPTQEYPSDRPQGTRPTQGFPSQPLGKPSDSVIPHFPDDVQNITERRIPTKDGELIIVSSEKKRNYKHQTNSERIVETEHNIRDDQQDFSTHGFPSVREPLSQPKNFPEQRQMQPSGYPMDKIPPGTRIITTSTSPNDDAVVVSSQKSHTVKNTSNTERIIEHEVVRDDQGFPRKQPGSEPNNYNNYTVTTPGDQYPGTDFPTSTRKSPSQDYSTQGFPSVRSPNKSTPYDQGYPSRDEYKPNAGPEQPRMAPPTKTQPRAMSPNKSRAPNTTRDTTERVIRKEKEVDSAHRAFAASLRSSSPLDSYTTDSHGRHTPRSSVSSTKNVRRDMREGSHDSAPSETSRFSNTTVTRQTPPRSLGGKTTVTRVTTTKTSPGSNENLNVTSPRATKSPSPGKTVTTTTTTKTITSKTPTSPTKEVPKPTDNQPTRNTSTTTNKPDSIFPINEPLTITKINFSDNHTQHPVNNIRENPLSPGIIEEPCLKKTFYLLGPSDQLSQKTPTNPYNKSKKFEKSPLKQISSPQSPAPSSRTSTLSYKSSKPLMADDDVDDDDNDQPEKFNTTQPAKSSPLSPSRSRTPKQPVNDERRTVNRETTFEKIETLPQEPRKPSYDQPNIEWIVVDDVDIDNDDDDEDYEDVDFGLNIKRTTKNLITHEKEVPLAPRRGTKPTTDKPSNIRTNSQEITRPQAGPKDRSTSKTSPPARPQKPLTESKTPLQYKSQSKTPIVKNQPKSPNKEVSPLSTPHQRKPQVKPVIEKTTEILKEKTTKIINEKKMPLRETPKRRDISPENKPTPSYRQPKETEIAQKRVPDRESPNRRSSPETRPKLRYPERESPNRKSISPVNRPKQGYVEEETILIEETKQPLYPNKISPQYPEETDDDEIMTINKSTQKRIFIDKEIQELEKEYATKPNYPKKEAPKYVDLQKPQKGPKSTIIKENPQYTQALIPNQKKPKQNMPVDDLSFRKTLRTTEILTTKMIDDEEFPEVDIYNKDQPRPKGQPKELTSDFENISEPEEDETFIETSEFVINSIQKSPKPEPKSSKQNLPNEDQTIRKTLSTTFDDEEFPEEQSPKKEGSRPERRPKNDRKIPGVTNENETFTATSEFVIKSSQKRVEKQFPDLDDNNTPKSVHSTKQPKGPKFPKKDVTETPKKDVSPSRTQKKPEQKSLKTTEILKETTTKPVEDKYSPKKDKPYKKDHKPEYVPQERYLMSDQLTESEQDETCTETNEIFIKSTQKQMISEKQIRESSEINTTEPHYTDKNVLDSKKPQKGPRYPNNDNELPKTLKETSTLTLEDDEEIPKKDTPNMKGLKPKSISKPETDDDEIINETSEYEIITSQKCVESEEESYKKAPKPRESPNYTSEKDIPTSSSSPLKPYQKKVPVNDQVFRNTLRTTDEVYTVEKTKPIHDKPAEIKPVDTDEEEDITEKEEFVIETCQKRITQEKKIKKLEDETLMEINNVSLNYPANKAPKDGPISKEPTEKKPEQDTPQYTTTLEEIIETIQNPYYPQSRDKMPEIPKTTTETIDDDTLKPNNENPEKPKPTTSYKETTTVTEENWLPKKTPKTTSNINEKFIETERVRTETPDGAFISKTTESPEPLSPTFKKKGAGRRDTFEDRCRQILGMETYGDTPGNYKNQPIQETTTDKEEFEKTTVFQVKIEDCGEDDDDDDDEPTSINSVKENIHGQIHTTEQKRNEPFNEKPSETKEIPFEPKEPTRSPIKAEPKNKHSQPMGPKETPKKTPSQPFGTKENPLEEPKKKPNQPSEPKRKSVTKDDDDLQTITGTKVITTSPRNISPETRRKPSRDAETIHTITETTVYKKSPKIIPLDDTDDISDQETYISSSHITDNLEQIEVVNTKNQISEMKINRSVSPTKKTSPVRSESPTKETKNLGTPKRKPSRETVEPKSIKTTPKKQAPKPDTDSPTTTTLKDRLRSSTRKTKSPTKHDQVDGSESSPEPSPTRISERRRSSNISVTTEIIIDHTEVPSSEKTKKSPVTKKHQVSVVRDIIDSTVLPEKLLPRKMLVTERKESAPVHRVTQKDKDSKMSRSTSENLIKVKKPESNNLSPKTTPKSHTDHRRPNKCFATKSINLIPTDRLVNSEDMENVIIDIQHAKSSREPSPDKIVPTPVPAHLDTGKPRYPDEVQEPEDEQPRRKPQVKNIPIFEEENNSYVGFHITEVNVEKSRKTTMDSLDYDHEILNNPLIEAPPSLDYPSLDKPNDDECLLTVHEKVSKFQNIAEEVKKPKASSPFNREFDESTKVPVDDECLLTIDEKVDKFLKTAENVTKTITPGVRVEKIPYFEETDEEFERNERIFSSVKLAPTAPQKSPDLVRNISRNISRQSEAEPCEDNHPKVDGDYSHVVTANEDLVECLRNNKKTTKECEMTHQQTSAEKYHQIPYKRNNDHDDYDDDDEELIPHTATHTTILEERRQKDILTRPSVFDNKSNKKHNAVNTTTTTTTTTKTPLKHTPTKSPVKDSEKLRPDIKSRTKPATTAEHKHSTEQQQTKTSAYTSKHRQSPQRKHTNDDYELRAGSGSNNVETGVGIISKQTKVYNKNNYTSTTSNSSTTDNFKKSTQLLNTKPEKHIPVRLIPAKNLDENDLNTDEMIINIETTTSNTTTSNINDSSSVVNGKINKEPYNIKPITPHHPNLRKQPTAPQHSSTNSSPLNNSKEHVTTTKLIERSTLKHNLDITSKITEPVESPETIEPVLEPTKRGPFTPKSTKTTTTTTMDTVAARRSLFENNQGSVTPTKRTPTASPLPGRRPSYMDHTKSSLEHTRRDSLEINKTHYSRKPSQPEDDNTSLDRHSMVKFNVPQNKMSHEVTTTTTTSQDMDDINIEEIFDIDILERMLETVTSYEIRRRIRAQIRIIKKNQKNELTTVEVTTKTVKTLKPTREETDNTIRKPKPDRSLSPIGKTTKQFLTKESESHSLTRKQNLRKEEQKSQSPIRPKSSPSSSPDRYDHGDSEYIRDRSPESKRKPSRSSERSRSPQEKPVCARNVSHNRPHGHDDEDELIPHTATHTTIIEERRQRDILSRPSVFDTQKPNERSRSPEEKPVCLRNVAHNRSHSPEVREEYGSRTTTKKHNYYNEEEHEEMEEEEINRETRKQSSGSTTHITTRKSYSPRKSPSPHTSPERRDSSPENKKPLKSTERSRSPPGKTATPARFSSRSPDTKTSASLRKSSTSSHEQTLKSSSSTSTKQQKRVPMLNTPIKTKPEKQNSTPLWADRRNLLKTPGSTTPKKPATTSLESRSGFTKTIKSTSSQRMTSTNKSSFIEDDCITSSYGIGPTDENGLPLFGIRALKKKKPSCEPCETTEEVTGYIVEEKCYSDNKTKPVVERKELIYSTNPEELKKIKDQVKGSSALKSLKDAEIKEYRQTALISKTNPKATPALRSSPEDDFLDSATKYVRRGSVKEMSEKFIHRESSSSITEKSSYPKAGLILRTNSRKNSRDNETDGENYDSYKTTRVQHTKAQADSDDAEHEYEVEEIGSRHSGRFITESESEAESIKTQREFKKITSSTSSSTRSFLNTQGEEKVITNVSDCLERMRNADNVIEDGDSTEDQEARALLNKFLGASIIMKGVESSIAPAGASNRQSKILTTTTTTNNKRGDSNTPPKHEVKTTRITKTIKSGSSSSPVIQTTCDIEEIWDEEILKELLEQAKTYEERRKIRSRLRELMADREEKTNSQAGEKEVKPSPEIAKVEEEEDSSASEYEEIIEEVTDCSESESAESFDDKNTEIKEAATTETKKVTEDKAKLNESNKLANEEGSKKSVTSDSKKSETSSSSSTSDEETVKEEVVSKNENKDNQKDVDAKSETKNDKIEEVEVESKEKSSVDETDSSEKGESLMPLLQDKLPETTMPQGGTSQQRSTNSQKLKSVQSSISKTTTGGIKAKTSSETSSMHAPHNKLSSAASKSSQNPIVTVQTAGRTDPSSVSNKTLNSSSGIHHNKSSSVSVSNTVVVGNNSPRQVDRLGVPQKEDSGTESGEDLRLIAAGLRDQLQIQSDSNIIEDVTCALSRLESSLKEGKDIAVDLEKRKALLALVARLQAGLTSPEKLAEIAAAMSELDGNEGLYGESSSPEADAHRSNRSRFAKRRSRINRHTVGVSREELADARRYMEDMIMLGNISQSTTPEVNNPNNTSPPQWYPLEKNASVGAILTPPSPSVLQRPKQFLPAEENLAKNTNKLTVNNANKRRPLSGEFSVSFEPQVNYQQEEVSSQMTSSSREINQSDKQTSPTDDTSKFARFSNKKHLMKRANTIDIAKTQKYSTEFDTDSDAEDKGPYLGLKRTVQVSVKKRVGNVVPAFEPKTENDRKFLAFINKQSDKPGLGWTSSRSVSNWSNKFGSIKNTFEGGLVSKPPQVPHHVASSSKPHNSYKPFNQPVPNNSAAPFITTNQQIAQRLKQEADRQAEERRRKLEREHLEYERRERDQLERQRQQKERQERERLEREYFERQRREQDQIAAAQHAAIRREQEKVAMAQQQQHQQAANVNVPKPMPINEFKHAPQSVFRPIDNVDAPAKPIYKPIPQLPMHSNNWQSLTSPHRGINSNSSLTPTSPNNYGNTRPDNSFITSPTPSSRSPIGLPWASKPTVDSSSFKTKANHFEERSKYDNISSGAPLLHRHNSLRSANGNAQQLEEFRKRPSLPNTCDPYSVNQMPQQHHQDPLAYLPPPQNISFSYSDLKPNRKNYQSYPCLPTAVINNTIEPSFERSREDSLTDPNSMPLVLSANNPSYCPPTPPQQFLNQPPLPRQFDIVSPLDSAPTSPSVMLQTDCTDDDIDSDNLLECHAISRVMRKPQSQTAVTIGRRTGHASDDELFGKNSRAARNLLSTMKNIGNPNGDRTQKPPTLEKRSEQVTSPIQCFSPDGRSYQAPIVAPLFPEVTNFEPNRKPLYAGPQTRPTYTPKYEIPRQNMYKSLENLNRPQTTNQIGYMTPQAAAAPLPAKPYVSETQTSYVVTYPTEETDDEDVTRLGQKQTKLPPTSLDLRRQRNISENSTGSSTTASISYNHNLPSPNTSWTANPIMSNDYNNYQNMADQKQTQPRNLPQANVRSLNQSLADQTYTYQTQSTIMSPQQMPTDYMRTPSYEAQAQRQVPAMSSQQHEGGQMSQQPPIQKPGPKSPYEIPPQRPLPTMAAQQLPIAPTQSPSISQQLPTPSLYEIQQQKQQLPNQAPTQQPPIQKPYEKQPERQLPTITATSQLQTAKSQQSPIPTSTQPQKQHQPVAPPMKTSASGYEAQPQRQLQTMTSQQNQINQNKRVSTKKQTSKSNYESQSQRQIMTMTSQQQQQQPLRTQKPPITQKPTDYQILNTQQQNKLISQSLMTQEKITTKKSLASMRKSMSEDHPNVREQIVINPQNSNISQEMISKLDQQRERVNNEIRRKSLGNTLDHHGIENQVRFETQHSELYTSSAPLDTPDIVKSSLPKDDNQPILKKFGPPQRHHYIPNAYQSPGTNVAQSTTIHTKNMEVSSSKTTVKTSQQQQQHMLSIARPTVVETPATPQPDDDYIPRNIVYNNVHAFTSMSRRHDDDTFLTQEQPQTRPNKLSKSDSWNQIIQLQNQNMPAPAPKFNQSPTNELRRTKSGHTLALPKMFEAAMAKADISEKQKTVAAYFTGQKSPTQQELVMEQHTTRKSVINRTKTSEKVSASRKSLGSNLPIAPGGLTRSATMPHIANLNLLDESNVEDAFEQLMLDQKQQKSSSSTTEKTETKEKDGAVVTTTTKVTTRTVTGSAPKPVSPFAKFKQLDTQNSQQSAKSPTTPTTPGGSSTASPSSGNQPIFKFTDPALNARAATVKDQLLQWCQMKTQEYENIEITNFSTSWNNGLAFCALIHHFLPDAFDYSQLTPKNRRKNFDLAFTVADEKAGIAPLLDVEDMVVMQRPDWKCVFVYVQSIYRRFRNCQ